jgi:hypothetical protein
MPHFLPTTPERRTYSEMRQALRVACDTLRTAGKTSRADALEQCYREARNKAEAWQVITVAIDDSLVAARERLSEFKAEGERQLAEQNLGGN